MTVSLPRSVAFGGSKTGLGSVGMTLLNPDGSEHTARTTANIYETDGGGYGKNIEFPDNWKGIIKWDSGEGSPVYAYEDYNYLEMSGEVGAGALSCTWTQKDEDEVVMGNVEVWISTDEEGTNVIAGTLVTNTSGEVTFMLDAGSYYVWREKPSFNFTNPQEWAVS